jgi:glycosyltransferase involved in cell wall biosynthesis
MKKNRILFIQPLLPTYSIDFFNEMLAQSPELELTVAANLKSKSPLNQLSQGDVAFNTLHLEFTKLGPFQWICGLWKAINAKEFDIVVFSGNPRDLSQLLAMFIMKAHRRKVYVWGMFHKIGRQRWHTRSYYKLVAKVADKLLTYSRTGARNLASLGVPEEKISIIGTAIDQRRTRDCASQVSETDIKDFLKEQGLTGKKIVLQVVRLSAIKKPGFLLEAAKEILKERNDIVFVLIGDGEMRSELESKVIDYDISHAVRFMGAIYNEAQLAKWFLASSVFVMSTCIGLSAHHALSYGLPVITDDSLEDQASEFDVLAHGINSLIYRKNDIDDFKNKLIYLVQEKNVLLQMSQNAFFTISQVYSIENKAENMVRSLTEK